MTDDTQATPTIRCIRTARVIAATPAECWRAWTDPSIVKTWWGKTAKATNVSCDVDARVGGRLDYRFKLPQNEAETKISAEVIEVSAPTRLVFDVLTWGEQDSADGTRVTVEFMDLQDGTSRAVVTHEGVTAAQLRTQCFSTWSNALQDLASAGNT